MPPVLRVENLRTRFRNGSGYVDVVKGISYEVDENEIVGLVGESGCGKTVSQLSVMGLIWPPAEIAGGKILFEERDLLEFPPKGKEMGRIRGAKISMVFQEPAASLNPVLTIGRQMTEVLEKHLGMKHRMAKDRAAELLAQVGIRNARARLGDYPHQFSGGMLQRVMIAMALSCGPKILIADEPTSALDVTTQARILELLNHMVSRMKTSMMLVTHDLEIVARYARRVYVMYAGEIVEYGMTSGVFYSPCHPYTIGLLLSRRRLNNDEKKTPLIVGEDTSPAMTGMSGRCSFLPRCASRSRDCLLEPLPLLTQVKDQHYVRCYGVT